MWLLTSPSMITSVWIGEFLGIVYMAIFSSIILCSTHDRPTCKETKTKYQFITLQEEKKEELMVPTYQDDEHTKRTAKDQKAEDSFLCLFFKMTGIWFWAHQDGFPKNIFFWDLSLSNNRLGSNYSVMPASSFKRKLIVSFLSTISAKFVFIRFVIFFY